MARPSTFADIDSWQADPYKVAVISLSLIDLNMDTAPVFAKVAELGQLLEACGLNVKMDGSDLTATRSKSPAELTRLLIMKQKTWDELRSQYLKAIEDPASIEPGWQRTRIDNHARGEGLPAIVWPAEEDEEEILEDEA